MLPVATIAEGPTVYVTAASSVALVLGTVGFVAGGAVLAARKAAYEMSQSAGSAAPKPQKRPRLKPMLAKEQQPSVVPPPTAESVDEVQQ